MTDAELATLQAGDRVRDRETLADPNTAGTVTTVDRRVVYWRRDGTGALMQTDAEFLTLLPPPTRHRPAPLDEIASLLDARWRAVTDEVLAALHVVTAAYPLGELAVTFTATREELSAHVWRMEDDELVDILASCAVGLTINAPERAP